MPLPPNDEPKSVPLFNCSYNTADLVVSILRSVDRFYKPKTVCRRKFTLNGVRKYYPTRISNVQVQNSFLYKNKVNGIYKACEDFILGECLSIYSETFGCNYKTGRCNTFYMLDVPSNLRFRSKKRSGIRCGNSFSPTSSRSVSFAQLAFASNRYYLFCKV